MRKGTEGDDNRVLGFCTFLVVFGMALSGSLVYVINSIISFIIHS